MSELDSIEKEQPSRELFPLFSFLDLAYRYFNSDLRNFWALICRAVSLQVHLKIKLCIADQQ